MSGPEQYPQTRAELRATGAAPPPAVRGIPAAEPTPGVPAPELRWAPPPPVRKGLGGSALTLSAAGLACSFVVGWAIPLSILGLVFGILAVRSPVEGVHLGRWSIVLGILGCLYSLGWLAWGAYQLGMFG